MIIKIGTVSDNTSFEKDGTFKVCFDFSDEENRQSEIVKYVSPYGSDHAGFFAIPTPGSLVICAKADTGIGDPELYNGYYYLGSVVGPVPGINNNVITEDDPTEPSNDYIEKTSPGVHGPNNGKPAHIKNLGLGIPEKYQGAYDGKKLTPEQIGLTSTRADNLTMSLRSSPIESGNPWQDFRIQMESGSGKVIKCVDTPEVDGIVITNEHGAKDYIILSTGDSDSSPFSEGEYHVRTHGPINQYTTENNMRLWVQDGLNLQIENLTKTGDLGYTKNGQSPNVKATTNEGGPSTRINDFGNETWGCVEVRSLHNNVIVEALAEDSVIRIVAPGEQSKVIVNTGGTVDIIADKKITLKSGTEIELTAPEIDINGTNNVYIDGGRVDLNLPHPPPEE